MFALRSSSALISNVPRADGDRSSTTPTPVGVVASNTVPPHLSQRPGPVRMAGLRARVPFRRRVLRGAGALGARSAVHADRDVRDRIDLLQIREQLRAVPAE